MIMKKIVTSLRSLRMAALLLVAGWGISTVPAATVPFTGSLAGNYTPAPGQDPTIVEASGNASQRELVGIDYGVREAG